MNLPLTVAQNACAARARELEAGPHRSEYSRSQSLAYAALFWQRAGDSDQARRCYREAAEIEEAHVRSLDPAHKPQSVAVYGANAGWHFFRAGEVERAAALVRDFGEAGERDLLMGDSWRNLRARLEEKMRKRNAAFEEDRRRTDLCGCQRCVQERKHQYPAPLCFPGPCFPGWRYACELCGNKRCPHHADHRFACTGSNEPGQVGTLIPEQV